jgi:glutamate racemase
MSDNPIGVFDSGIGGLTVAKAIMNELPHEKIVYFGDLVHLPYGNKSSKAIKEFSLSNTRFLISKNVKIIVVACNSASSIAFDEIKNSTTLPVVGVVEPGAECAIDNTKTKKIGVIGTLRTVLSGSYEKAIKHKSPDARVFQKATPLLVPLIEENWINKHATRLVIREYLEFFKNTNIIDTLVLGCTHYPLIKKVIEEEMIGVNVIDSAKATALKVKEILKAEKLLCDKKNSNSPIHEYYVNDITESFAELAYRIIGKQISITNISEQ